MLLVLVPFPVGEATAGKASRSLAQHIPGSGGVEGVKGAAGSAIGELARARIALDERGQKLGELDEKTARMMASAEAFSKHAHEVSVHSGQELGTIRPLCHVKMGLKLLFLCQVYFEFALVLWKQVLSSNSIL